MRDPLVSDRVRKIKGSYAFIEHRFLRHGFWASLSHEELLLYFFPYPYDKICSLLTTDVDLYIQARNSLINKNFLAFDGTFFQVLSLPTEVTQSRHLLPDESDMKREDPATIHQIICTALGKSNDQ